MCGQGRWMGKQQSIGVVRQQSIGVMGFMMGKLCRVLGFDVEDDGGTNVEGRGLMIKRKGAKGQGMA